MMAYVILHSPKKHECRHKQHRASVGTEYAAHFAQTGNIIIEMLHDIKSGDQIERGICERQALSRALLYLDEASRPTEIERCGGDINTFSCSEVRQHL